jgi:hypothetical protein
MIPPSWPFAVWGVDILGPFPRAIGGYRFLFIAIDKFTKWPKANPVVSITQGAAVAKPYHYGQQDPVYKSALPGVL